MQTCIIQSFNILLLCVFTVLPLNAQVINYDTSISVDKHKKTVEKSIVLQINNRDQSWLSDIEIPYNISQKVDIIEAYISDARGQTVRKLKKKDIYTQSDISYGAFYEDDYIKKFTLNWNTYPYRVTYRYKVVEEDFLYVAGWYPIVHNDIPTLNASLKLELPKEYKVSLDYSDKLTYTTETQEKKQVYSWQISAFMIQDKEIYSTHILETIPYVKVIPIHFRYGVEGSQVSWASYGKWHEHLNEDLQTLPQNEIYKVNQLIEGISDKKEIIRVLYHYLQDNVRYVNVAIDVGGLKPYPASYVAEKKYGDCKALTIYMKSLLKYAGIDSYYTIVYAGDTPRKIKTDLPSQQFNHVILTVPLEKDTVWLENTSNYNPVGYLGTFTQNRYALLVDGENSHLVRTPALNRENVLVENKWNVQLNREGNGAVSIEKVVRGDDFETYNYYYHKGGQEDLKSLIIKDFYLPNTTLKENRVVHSNRDQKEMVVYADFALKQQFREVGNMKVISPKPISLPAFEDPDERKTGVCLSYPIHQSDTISYQLPFVAAFDMQLPKPVDISTEYGFYKEKYTRKEDTVLLLRTFCLFRGDYAKAEYPAFYSFIKSIRKSQKQSVIILTERK